MFATILIVLCALALAVIGCAALDPQRQDRSLTTARGPVPSGPALNLVWHRAVATVRDVMQTRSDVLEIAALTCKRGGVPWPSASCCCP